MARFAVLVLVACSGTPHVATDAGHDAAPAWLSTQVTLQDDQIVVEQVTYASGSLVVHGQVCRPADAAVHPVFVLLHGGFAGLTSDTNAGLCVVLARQRVVVLEPAYRGEDGSQGNVEVCLGEVDDVIAMTAIALAMPYADPQHVSLHGASHGGCIALRALERGLPVQVASEGFGITDMAADYAYWQSELAADPSGPNAGVLHSLVDQLDTSVGGAPGAYPAAYEARSPTAYASALPNIPLMIAHGTADPLVALAQSCSFAASAGGFHAYHLDTTQTVVTTAPAGCDGFTWLAGPLPAAYPAGRYLLVYDGVGHEFTSQGGQAMALQLVEFALGSH